ncbi:hypothetical protein [Halpernia sp. GG3]
MKYFLSLILLSIITLSCAQDFRVINANKSAVYMGTSGFSGWNIKVKVKENLKNINYKYFLKDGRKSNIEVKILDSNHVEISTFEDLSVPSLTYGEVVKKRNPPTNRGQIFYIIGKQGKLKNVLIENFNIVNSSSDKILRQ